MPTRRLAKALVAVLLPVVLFLSGCTVTSTGAGGGSTDSTLTQVLRTHTIKIGILTDNAPYSSLNLNGQPQGFDVDIATAIANTLGAKPDLVKITGAGRVAALQSHQVQLVVGDFTMTPQRAETVSFSTPYLLPRGQFLVKANRSDLKTVSDLNKPNIRVCVGQGGTAVQLVPRAVPKATIVTLTSGADCAQAVLSGQADATSQDELTNYGLMKAKPGAFKVVSGSFTTAMISIGTPLGDPEWLQWVNYWIQNDIATGNAAARFAKWWPGYQGAPPLPTVSASGAGRPIEPSSDASND